LQAVRPGDEPRSAAAAAGGLEGLFLTNNVAFIAINGLVGLALAPSAWLARASMDPAIFATMTVTSFSSGALVTTRGWAWIKVGSIVPVLLTAAALAWFAARRRRTVTPAA
jgi:hypothetical protein